MVRPATTSAMPRAIRTETEWHETVAAGANRLVSPDDERAIELAVEAARGSSFDPERGPFGDGAAAAVIASELAS